MKIMKIHYLNEFSKGLFKENPALVLLLGLCPSLAISTMLVNGIGMGLAVTFVLVFSKYSNSFIKRFYSGKSSNPGIIL